MPHRLFRFLFLLALAWRAEAGLYKWVDENGVVHYGERPPAQQPFERIRPARTPPPDPAAAERLRKLREQIESSGRERDEAAKKQARQEAEAERKRRNCAIARRNLANLEMGGRKKLRGPDGVAYFPTPEEIEAKKAAARKAIKENCE